MARQIYSDTYTFEKVTGVTIGVTFFHPPLWRIWGRLEMPGTSNMVVYRYYVVCFDVTIAVVPDPSHFGAFSYRFGLNLSAFG